MSSIPQDSPLLRKTLELCQAILDEPGVRAMRQKIDTFMADSAARGQYENLMQKGDALHQKQHAGQQLDRTEVAEFERLRETFLKNPIASAFLDAQEELHKVQQSISQHVSKTFEMGRVPTTEDMESGGCGHGCGCHH